MRGDAILAGCCCCCFGEVGVTLTTTLVDEDGASIAAAPAIDRVGATAELARGGDVATDDDDG